VPLSTVLTLVFVVKMWARYRVPKTKRSRSNQLARVQAKLLLAPPRLPRPVVSTVTARRAKVLATPPRKLVLRKTIE